MASQDLAELARRIQQLAESGDYEGFNAIVGALTRNKELDAAAIDTIKTDSAFRNRITDICREAWGRRHRQR